MHMDYNTHLIHILKSIKKNAISLLESNNINK